MTYEEAKEQVAKKYKLGKTLVIGHRPAYYEEAAMLFARFHVEAALKKASESQTFAYEADRGRIFKEVYPLTHIK